MYEVEVKAALRDRNAVMKKLENLGCKFGEVLHQIDHIFAPKGSTYPAVAMGTTVLRVRKQNAKYIFTLKIPQNTLQDCLEREMEIEDGEKMIEILTLMKWDMFPTVDKKRVKTNYKDMEIVLDTVEHLGEFIEAEKIVAHQDYEDRKKVKAELLTFLETLGIPKEDEIIDGKYDIMLFEKLKNSSK